MGKVTVYLHKKTQDFADSIATLLDTSRSEVVEDMIKHIRDEGLEKDVWGDEYTEALEESEEEESEEETEEEED